MPTLYYSHPAFLEHDTGPGHPECAARLLAIDEALNAPNFKRLIRVQAKWRDDLQEKVALIHSPAMIDGILNSIPHQGLHALDHDTILSPGSGTAALLAVAAVCDAVDKLCTHQATSAFCAVRPPGHHAEPDRPMGFCLFNNIAIAAEYARLHYSLGKIAIIDFDVHHGNGTQAAFYKQPQILYASSHEMPHYPGTGHPKETGVGNIVNVPLHPGSSSDEFRQLYSSIILPAVQNFKPDLILISAGFDAHQNDPLAGIRLSTEDYQWVTEHIKAIAEESAKGRVLSVLEGGYHIKALAESVAAHVKSLMNPVRNAF
ncbi:histone deacetylase family protein [Methylotuvimicrobium alcaliphilum]|uniref:Histone deacetylase domain-containing protein n=1 Tax=Methylotuvimicrobium alcaliphilum (strain DSM 19304 / NCIMB 14124 / VKM B-2133 / 20Z) TaxID=1091494 RepID=G4T0V7_META2|nr:histone deacetylase family protein [Methylotuvimicrobium alcaliphilum]CCE23391.1 conserved protein of unknown function [Methylotuvimicrobium alcaliphilum 20Z]